MEREREDQRETEITEARPDATQASSPLPHSDEYYTAYEEIKKTVVEYLKKSTKDQSPDGEVQNISMLTRATILATLTRFKMKNDNVKLTSQEEFDLKSGIFADLLPLLHRDEFYTAYDEIKKNVVENLKKSTKDQFLHRDEFYTAYDEIKKNVVENLKKSTKDQSSDGEAQNISVLTRDTLRTTLRLFKMKDDNVKLTSQEEADLWIGILAELDCPEVRLEAAVKRKDDVKSSLSDMWQSLGKNLNRPPREETRKFIDFPTEAEAQSTTVSLAETSSPSEVSNPQEGDTHSVSADAREQKTKPARTPAEMRKHKAESMNRILKIAELDIYKDLINRYSQPKTLDKRTAKVLSLMVAQKADAIRNRISLDTWRPSPHDNSTLLDKALKSEQEFLKPKLEKMANRLIAEKESQRHVDCSLVVARASAKLKKHIKSQPMFSPDRRM